MMNKAFEIDNFLTIGISKILKKRKFKKFKTPRFFSLIFIFGVISLAFIAKLQKNRITMEKYELLKICKTKFIK